MDRGAWGAVSADAPARVAWLLARAGEGGMTVADLCAAVPCSTSSLYRHIDRAVAAGWPVEAVHVGDARAVAYRLRGYVLQPLDGAEPVPDVRPSRSSKSGRTPSAATQQIDALAAQGLSSTEIARQTGIKPSRVQARMWALRAAGNAPPPAPRSRSALTPGGRPERIRDMTLAGAREEEIAAAVETTVSTVRSTTARLRRDGHLPPSQEGDVRQ